jgi:hypothetical protein
MNSYVYTGALPGTGQVRGVVEADSLGHARALLASMHITPVDIDLAPPPRPLSADDLYALNQQLILMVDSGMPLEPGLRMLAQDVRDKRLAGTLDLIARETESGLPLVEAFAKHQALFPVMYSQIVASGLARGDLSLTLTDLSRRMEFQESIRKSLWKALTYPGLPSTAPITWTIDPKNAITRTTAPDATGDNTKTFRPLAQSITIQKQPGAITITQTDIPQPALFTLPLHPGAKP